MRIWFFGMAKHFIIYKTQNFFPIETFPLDLKNSIILNISLCYLFSLKTIYTYILYISIQIYLKFSRALLSKKQLLCQYNSFHFGLHTTSTVVVQQEEEEALWSLPLTSSQRHKVLYIYILIVRDQIPKIWVFGLCSYCSKQMKI